MENGNRKNWKYLEKLLLLCIYLTDKWLRELDFLIFFATGETECTEVKIVLLKRKDGEMGQMGPMGRMGFDVCNICPVYLDM